MRAATSKGPSCPQAVPKVRLALPGSSEDCLTLDVETPPVAQAKRLPVMVWFYGGAYALGSTSQYDETPLVTQGDVMQLASQFTSMALTFLPDVDGYVEPRTLDAAFGSGNVHHVPVLIGGQHDEGRLFVALFRHLLTGGRPTPAEYAADVRAVFGDEADAVLRQYPASRFGSTDLTEAQVWTDGLFACNGLRATAALGATGTPVYAYEFTDPAPPLTDLDPLMPLGDFHGSDLFYLFSQALQLPRPLLNADQQHLSTEMTSYWTTFARTGDPNGPATPPWPAWSPSTPQLQNLTSTGSSPVPAASFSTSHDCTFWNSLP